VHFIELVSSQVYREVLAASTPQPTPRETKKAFIHFKLGG
jgi:hypothetical protein